MSTNQGAVRRRRSPRSGKGRHAARPGTCGYASDLLDDVRPGFAQPLFYGRQAPIDLGRGKVEPAHRGDGVGGEVRDDRPDAPESALWDAHYHVDVLGAVRLTELLAPQMRERRSGSIVFVSSISGKMTYGCEHGYTAMKAALIAAGKTLAVELAGDGVRLNVVAPGTIATTDMERMLEVEPDRVRELEAAIPSGRFGRAEEVASCIAFLISEQASWVVGHCLVVDGGQFPGIA